MAHCVYSPKAWAIRSGVQHWQTMVFTVLTLSQMMHVLAIRSDSQSLYALGPATHPMLLAAVSLTVALQWLLIYVPAFNTIFKTGPLSRRAGVLSGHVVGGAGGGGNRKNDQAARLVVRLNARLRIF